MKLSTAQQVAVNKLLKHGELINYRPFWSADGVERKPLSVHHPELVPIWNVDRITLIALERKGVVEFTEYDSNGIQMRVKLSDSYRTTLSAIDAEYRSDGWEEAQEDANQS